MREHYKKGVVELCVLAMLARGDSYGYDIADRLASRIFLSDGAVYPVLRKLKSDGFVTTYLSEASGGPPRKYYSLTALGREELSAASKDWLAFAATVQEILEEGI